jgi:hypothetical protein
VRVLLVFALIFISFGTIAYAQEDGSDCASCCDGLDNDGDGFIDWDDFDCNQTGNPSDDCPWCTTESSCDNGVDDDGDGLVDSDDNDCGGSTVCSTPIWEEDFESYSNGTQNATKWTTTYNDCDDASINSGANYWGVYNGEFRVNDIEGATCCGGGGENDNYFTTEKIDVSSYGALSISIEARVVGDVECSSTCNSGDILQAQYEVDGGGWNTFYEMCGATSGTNELNCEPITIGNELQIRIKVGNQANSETYYFDNIKVCPDNCGVSLKLPSDNPKKTLSKDVELSRELLGVFDLTGQSLGVNSLEGLKSGIYILKYKVISDREEYLETKKIFILK